MEYQEKEEHTCPRCKKKVYGRENIEEEFGYRYSDKYTQSYCKKCRNEHQREQNLKNRER